MARSVADLVGAERGHELRVVAVAALVSGVVFWLLDAAVDAALARNGSFVEGLVRPSAVEVWIRLLVAALIVALYMALRSRARLRLFTSALEEAPDGVQIATLDGTVAWSNRAVQHIYGFAPEELRGKRVDEMNRDPTFASRVILPSLQLAGRWTGELEVKHKDGRTFPIWLTTAVVAGRRGEPAAAIGIIRDLTVRNAREEELRRNAERLEQATRQIERLAGVLRGELLGAASALNVALGLLDRRDPRSAARDRLLATARRSCATLLAALHDASRAASEAGRGLELGQLDLAEVLSGVASELEPLLREERAHVSLAAPGRCPARAHPLVAGVFATLLGSAVRHGPADGARVDVGVEDAGDAWKVSVASRGSRIADAEKAALLSGAEPPGGGAAGACLGLALARHIVELHRGKLWIDDDPSGGSVFCVTVPKA